MGELGSKILPFNTHTHTVKVGIVTCWNSLFYVLISGVFHASVSGLYLLSMYARTADDSGDLFVRKNDEVVCRTQVTGGNGGSDALGHDTGTCTGIAELVPEDSVRVTGTSDDPARIAAGKSGFIGHLIQPYC